MVILSDARTRRVGNCLWAIAVLSLVCLCLLGFGGCQWAGRLDQQITASHMDLYKATKVKLVFDEAMVIKYKELGDKWLGAMEGYTATQYQQFQAKYAGKEVPIDVVTALVDQLRKRDAEVVAGRQTVNTIASAATQANAGQRELITRAETRETNWAEFRKSARAYYDSMIQTLGGLAAGVLAGTSF